MTGVSTLACSCLTGDIEAAVWAYLSHWHTGFERAAPRARILAGLRAAGLLPETVHDREFRAICAHLVEAHHLPICTTSRGGYYVGRTREEIDASVRDLRARALAILQRANILETTRPSGQLALPMLSGEGE